VDLGVWNMVIKRLLAGILLAGLCGVAHATSVTTPVTGYIRNGSAPQAGAVFNVSSGAVSGQFSMGGNAFPSGVGTANQCLVSNGSGLTQYGSCAGQASGNVILNQSIPQASAVFNVSSGTVSGQATVGTLQGASLSLCGDSTHALSWNNGSFGCQTLSGGSGGGGYAVQPATVTFLLNQGFTASTGTINGNFSVTNVSSTSYTSVGYVTVSSAPFTINGTGGSLTVNDNTTLGAGANFSSEVVNTISGSASTINWQKGNKQRLSVNSSATLTFTAPSGPCSLTLRIAHDVTTNSYTITWPTMKWSGGIAPTLTQTSGAIDIIGIYFDGTNYNGSAGLNFQ